MLSNLRFTNALRFEQFYTNNYRLWPVAYRLLETNIGFSWHHRCVTHLCDIPLGIFNCVLFFTAEKWVNWVFAEILCENSASLVLSGEKNRFDKSWLKIYRTRVIILSFYQKARITEQVRQWSTIEKLRPVTKTFKCEALSNFSCSNKNYAKEYKFRLAMRRCSWL